MCSRWSDTLCSYLAVMPCVAGFVLWMACGVGRAAQRGCGGRLYRTVVCMATCYPTVQYNLPPPQNHGPSSRQRRLDVPLSYCHPKFNYIVYPHPIPTPFLLTPAPTNPSAPLLITSLPPLTLTYASPLFFLKACAGMHRWRYAATLYASKVGMMAMPHAAWP